MFYSHTFKTSFALSQYEATVAENKVDAQIVKMSVQDSDDPHTPAWNAKFKIVDGDPGGHFTVKTGINKQEGIISTAKVRSKSRILKLICHSKFNFISVLNVHIMTITASHKTETKDLSTESTVALSQQEVICADVFSPTGNTIFDLVRAGVCVECTEGGLVLMTVYQGLTYSGTVPDIRRAVFGCGKKILY